MPPALDLALSFVRNHPSAAAESLEALEPAAVAELLKEVPAADAAMVVSNLLPAYSASVLTLMSDATAADLVHYMSARAAASVLRLMERRKRETILGALGPTRRAHVALILRQPTQTVGAWTETNVPVLRGEDTVLAARDRLAGLEAPFDSVFVVDAQNRLLGVVPVAGLLEREAGSTLAQLQQPRPDRILASMSVTAALDLPCWDRSDIQPVVDIAGSLLGVIRYADLRRANIPASPLSKAAESDSAAIQMSHEFYLGMAEAMNIGIGDLIGGGAKKMTEARDE